MILTVAVDYATLEIRVYTTSNGTATVSSTNDTTTPTTTPDNQITTAVLISRPAQRAWDPNLEELEAALKARKTNFYPAKARAALPEKRPVQAPPRQPPKHLLHFANSRVWTRRNRPGI